MREFKFGEVKIDFLFNGKVYSINVNKAGKNMGKIGELLNEAATNPDVLEINVNEVLGLLDDILGKGSIDKIFEERTIEVGDVCDLVSFISTLVTEHSKNKKAEMEKALADAQTRRFVAQK